ncbi:MAG: cation transporter [Lachnospiraceae bacterium]|nr:cation transporter [Lachnospiraceae bacterium]
MDGTDESVPADRSQTREKQIIRTSMIGIGANAALAGFKAAVGLMTHSIAIVLDAVNNLSDAGSSLITIIGTKLAGKQPDKKHPFGHGRVEYLRALLISVIVLYAGITSLTESVKKIIHPSTPDYTTVSLVIVGVAVLVKIILGRYVKGVGEKMNSDSLVNSGTDAMLDAVISASTLVAAVLYLTAGISLEAWLGAIISVVIIKSGVDMLRETISQLLGESVDAEYARAIKKTVLSFPDVSGAYDLVLNNYGPDAYNGSIHIEVPDTYTASELDELIRAITMKVYEEHHVILTAVGVYSVNTREDEAARMRDRIYEEVRAHEYVNQVHGFYVNEEKKTIRFDVVVSFDAPDRRKVWADVCEIVQKMYPDYALMIAMDSDFSEE